MEVVPGRRSALIRAAVLAHAGDVLVIAGRSPAPRPQIDADGHTERFDDAGELRSALAALTI